MDSSKKITAALNDKELEVSLTASAQRALAERHSPLCVEMELYFSCLIRKQVNFGDSIPKDDAIPVGDRLYVRFHPVMSQVCSVEGHLDGPPVTDFPIVRQERFSPHWLTIDYRNGHWAGDFGY